MGKLILESFGLLPYDGKGPKDWDNFIEEIDVFVKEEGQTGNSLFRLKIISISWLLNQVNDETKWINLNHCLIMEHYDEKIIEQHLKNIISKCNLGNFDKSFNCLSHQLEFEAEEWLY